MAVGIVGDNFVGALAGMSPSQAFAKAGVNSIVQIWTLVHPLLSGLG
jgi:hypothetical protein